METTPAAPATPTPEKKPLFETIIISTPVILTVVATFILGRSSSEMTQAQYQRALASQNQSKVGDQWAFFQAKRIRGTTYEVTADLLVALHSDPFTRDSLLDTADAMVREIETAETRIGSTQFAAKKPVDSEAVRTELRALAKKAERAQEQVKAALSAPKDGWKGRRMTLTPENVKAAIDALDRYPDHKPDKNPEPAEEIDPDQKQKLEAILDDIRKFKPESEIAPKTLQVTPDTLEKAMEKAKARAAAVTDRGKAIDRVLEEIDALVEGQSALARDFHRAMNSQVSAMRKAQADDKEIIELTARMFAVRSLMGKLQGDYKAARHAFNAKRYEDDARSNQEAAYLYDVQVLRSSARSDRHLARSFMFMIAMLIAQVGVTVGTLALMFKFKLPVWAIAMLTGVIAVALGVCIYLEVMPLLFRIT